jgi:hypothetical protein
MTNQSSEWIRISCAALCRIEHQGKFLLLLNQNRRQKGVYQLGPIGGALRLYDLIRVRTAFHAVLENPTEPDLRLMLPQTMLPAFRDWFYTGEGRESSPFRELREELVDESHILSDLVPDDVYCHYQHTVENEQMTDRRGLTGRLTHYFLEIYDIQFKYLTHRRTLLYAGPETGAVWLPPQQLERPGHIITMDIDGARRDVRINAQLLVQPAERHETQGGV